MNPAHIRLAAGLAVSFSLLAPRHISAQQQSSSTVPYTPAVGRCLTPEQRKVNDNYNSLERPTRPGDEMPFWDPEYLVGTWDVEMRNQESPFGPGGESGGELTIKANARNGCLYEGTLNAEDADGKPFTRTISATYDPLKKILSWTEKDSRGYTILKQGPIGGELGGLFHHHFGDDASAPEITVNGHKVRLKGVSEMSSPAYFKTDLQISTDGAPFKTFGRITYEKQLAEGRD